ncbi:hypothetical protein C5167_014306 [Papaver somniferum]|uniref:Uncharacterized protein n=1 Tax=Papaver somniferum TaxID=3469 RepID=A0A4Y7J2U9_PAPSO|nr:hypothetical protein C5167_014306 [Papaver somniferum]
MSQFLLRALLGPINSDDTTSAADMD